MRAHRFRPGPYLRRVKQKGLLFSRVREAQLNFSNLTLNLHLQRKVTGKLILVDEVGGARGGGWIR